MHELKVIDIISDRILEGNMLQLSENELEDSHCHHIDIDRLQKQIHTFWRCQKT